MLIAGKKLSDKEIFFFLGASLRLVKLRESTVAPFLPPFLWSSILVLDTNIFRPRITGVHKSTYIYIF